MNEVIKAMIERRSCRHFKPDMLPEQTINQIIHAGLYAASGKGTQDVIILCATNKIFRDKLAEVNRQIGSWPEGFDPFYGAPVVLIVLGKKSHPTYLYDGSLVIGNLMLAAHTLGVASCWIHRAKEEFEMPQYKGLLKALGITEEYEGIGHCVLGYSAVPLPVPPARKQKRVYYVK